VIGPKVLSYKKIFEKKLFFKFLLTLKGDGVFSLVNKRDKKVYFLPTDNIIKSIIAATSLFSMRDLKRMHIEILSQKPEDFVSLYTMRQSYIDKGYTFYNRQPSYKAATRLMHDYRSVYVEVHLRTGGGRIMPIGEFKTQIDAEAFIANNSVHSMLKMIQSKKIT
jgi:hypothetical protein